MAGNWALVIIALAVVYSLYQRQTAEPVPEVQGSCTPAFKEVENVYRANYKSGLESGSSVAIYHKGKLVCDMWGGWADESNHLPWSKDTVSIVFSTTKGVSAIALALLKERGQLDYNELVSKYWPEFAQNGKEKVTVAQLLSHQAGLAVIDEDISLEDIRERPEKVSKAIEKQRPNWTPGTGHGYHALTFAIPVDQLIRRIDPQHRGLEQFFREEIAEPYGIDFDIGLPYEKQWRSARLVEPGAFDTLTNPQYMKFMFSLMVNGGDMMARAFANPKIDPNEYNWPTTRATPLGSALGSGSARGVAKLYSIVADPENHDTRLLSDKTTQAMTTIHTQGKGDKVLLGLNTTFGLGFMINEVDQKYKMFHHPGYGGQIGAGVPDLNLGWSYVTNYLSSTLNSFEDARVIGLNKALIKSINKL